MSYEDEMRQAFENSGVIFIARRSNGEYRAYPTQHAWEAWQAACAWQRERDDEVIKRLRQVQNSLNTWDSSRSEHDNHSG